MGRIFLILFLVVLAGLGIWLWHDANFERYGVEVDSVDWLPSEARTITFYQNSFTKGAEFYIEREAFERWCESIGKPLRVLESDDEETAVPRVLDKLEHKGVIAPPALRGETREEIEELASRHRKRFRAGDLYYGETWPNHGGHWIGYDVAAGKAYYYSASH